MTEQGPVLSSEQHQVLQMIYDKFREHGKWVTFGEVDRPLRRLGIKSDAVVESLTGGFLLPLQNGRRTPIARDELQLSLRGIAACECGYEDIVLFLRLIPWLVDRELNFEPSDNSADDMQVMATDIRDFLQLSDESAGALARLRHIIELQRWGWSGGEYTNGKWYIQVGRSISRLAAVETLDAYLDEMAKWEEEGKRPYVQIPDSFYREVPGVDFGYEPPQPIVEAYIPDFIISEIETRATDAGWNCDKLLGLIAELNDNHGNDNAYSAHALLRAILDHIPPLFGYVAFKEVANNYRWGRTDKNYAKRLLEFRDQADDVLHRQIGKCPDVITVSDLPSAVAIRRLLQECAGQL